MLNTQAAFSHLTDPFAIHLAQQVLTREQVAKLYATAPLDRAEKITRTDPDHEKQYRMNLVYLLRENQRSETTASLAAPWQELVDDLVSEEFTGWLEEGTGLALRDLVLDIGVYTHVDGDFISVHKDKPNKAITAILYLNEEWPEGAGGEYEVRSSGDPDAAPVRRIRPRPGQFLAFPPTDKSWHSVSKVDTGGTTTRLTVQLEYWFEPEDRRR